MPSAPVPVKPKVPPSLGQNIRKARERLGIDQLALATILGHKEDPKVSGSSYISKVENNITRPRIDTLQRIAEALGVKVGNLIVKPAADGKGGKK